MSSTVTRSAGAGKEPHWSEKLLGAPRDLPDCFLPTYKDLVRCYFLKIGYGKRKDLFNEMASHVFCLWEKSAIPTISELGVALLISRFFDGSTFKHFQKNKKLKGTDFNNLVDIGKCKCYQNIQTHDCKPTDCKCLAGDKIPDLAFYLDQRSVTRSKMIIFSDLSLENERKQKIDRENRKRKREEKTEQFTEKIRKESLEQFEIAELAESDDDSENDTAPRDPEATFSHRADRMSKRKPKPKYMHSMLLSERYHIHERPTVGLINMVVRDLYEEGFLKDDADLEQLMVDRKRVRKLKEEFSAEIVKHNKEASQNLICIKFDGRKDAKTLVAPSVYKTEEHVTIISEPDGKYRGFYTPKDGTGKSNAIELQNFLVCTGSVESFKAVGADGTLVNTGHNIGALKILQDLVQKVFQWIICLLHCNELPLRHLIELIDGKSSGPGSYKGPIMKELVECRKTGYKLPVTKFEKMEEIVLIEIPDELYKSLNNDCKQLYEHWVAIKTGKVPPSLEKKTPADFHQARWLTTAINILWLYERKPNPSVQLVKLTKIIVLAYIPNHFHIKKFWHIKNGATNFYSISQRYQNCGLEGDELILAKKHLQINGFMAHPESILLSAVFDPDLSVRHWAVCLILGARERRAKDDSLRHFRVPNAINFDAKSYTELLDFDSLDKELITEPPLLFEYSNEQLMNCALTQIDLPVPAIACHSQANERHVAGTTEAFEHAIGPDKAHALRLKTEKSRSEINKDATKSDFVNFEQS